MTGTKPAQATCDLRPVKAQASSAAPGARPVTIVEVDHKVRGKYLTVGSPIKFSDMKVDVKASPLLGEHTDEVLAEHGYDKQQIAALREGKAV